MYFTLCIEVKYTVFDFKIKEYSPMCLRRFWGKGDEAILLHELIFNLKIDVTRRKYEISLGFLIHLLFHEFLCSLEYEVALEF